MLRQCRSPKQANLSSQGGVLGVTNLDKPVDGAAVHQGWKHSAPGPEGLANWAHAENNVQLLPHSADEILKHLVAKTSFQFKTRKEQQGKQVRLLLSTTVSLGK